MAHRTFHLRNHHEGNAFAIPTHVIDSDGASKDLIGATATYYIKENPSQPDEEAYVTKEGDEGGIEDEIEFTSPGGGRLTVYVDSEETAGHVDWDSLPEDEQDEYDLWHRLDITDVDGNRVTVFTGRFVVVNS